MFVEPNESNARLREATAALRETPLRDGVLTIGEAAVLRRFAPRRVSRYRGLVLVAGLGAAAVAATILFLPAKSYAAELRRIAQNGDVGMRHVRTLEIRTDGSRKVIFDFYTDGSRALNVDFVGGRMLWANGELRYVQADGATEVHRDWNGNLIDIFWWNYPMKKVLAFNTSQPGTRVVADHIISRNGSSVDRFTIDEESVDARGEAHRTHKVLIADPAKQRPVEMQTDETGSARAITEWDYSKLDPKVFELPPADPTRVYVIDDELELVKTALGQRGKRVTIGGQSVELLQLWVDELGNACAIAAADYSWPDNYQIAIDGRKLEVFPEGEPFSGRYYVHHPSKQMGRSIQLFYGHVGNRGARVSYPDVVTVEIPVFENQALAGRAKFERVRVHRAHSVYMLLNPDSMPFWNKAGMVGAETARAAP